MDVTDDPPPGAYPIEVPPAKKVLSFDSINELQATLDTMVTTIDGLNNEDSLTVESVVVRLTIDRVSVACVFHPEKGWAVMLDE